MMQNQAVQDKIDSSMKSDMKSLTCDKFIKFLLKLIRRKERQEEKKGKKSISDVRNNNLSFVINDLES